MSEEPEGRFYYACFPRLLPVGRGVSLLRPVPTGDWEVSEDGPMRRDRNKKVVRGRTDSGERGFLDRRTVGDLLVLLVRPLNDSRGGGR